jgi:hypothetical protein
MKPTLGINPKDIKNRYRTLGMTEYLTYLIDSGEFNITHHEDRVTNVKGIRGTVLHYEGKKIFLDFWEYPAPTYCTDTYNKHFDLIIKLQHAPINYKRFNRLCARKKTLMHVSEEERNRFLDKIVPWSFFPSRLMTPFVGKEDEIEPLPVEQIGFFCGKTWKSRGKMKRKLEADGIEFTRSSQEMARKGRPLTDEEYIHKMRTSKYGIVLAGRASLFTQPKNRREIDYMMLKKPLLINYQPFYYNPLVEGKHYVFIDLNTDFDKLESLYNMDEIAENGYQWYKDNASPQGIVNTFKQIMKEKFDG